MDNNKIKGEVIHVVRPEVAINYRWYDNANSLPEEVQIVDVEELNLLPEEVKREKFGRKTKFNEGEVFLFEPYNQIYVAPEVADDVFLTSKYDTLMEICQYLGASYIKVEVEKSEEKTRILNADGNVAYKGIGLKGFFRSEENKNCYSKFNKEEEYDNPGPSVEGYEKAKQFCALRGIENDPEISRLLRQRDPKLPNLLKSQKYHFELSAELNKVLDAAIHLNAVKVFSLSATAQKVINTSKRVTIDVKIEF